MNPLPFTLRELVVMMRGSLYERWNHTAFLAATFVNMFSKRKVNAEDFHPFTQRASGNSWEEFLDAIDSQGKVRREAK